MVAGQLYGRDISDHRVLAAMSKVPRHLFMPETMREMAYSDNALAIAYEQTISQPYIVAFMTQILQLQGHERVLEIGTGSGYQAAVLAELVADVYSIEIIEELAHEAGEMFKRLGYTNIHTQCGDGYQGWPEYAPFDAVIVTCAPDHIPVALQEQLKVTGKMIIPVGATGWAGQDLVYLEKQGDQRLLRKKVMPVRFVPMTGQARKK
jgi:protein-L-isoaspartate(D-aspartate) O-methyltransferase